MLFIILEGKNKIVFACFFINSLQSIIALFNTALMFCFVFDDDTRHFVPTDAAHRTAMKDFILDE